MLIASEAIGQLSDVLLSSSGSIFHKCVHAERIFSDLWISSRRNLESKLDDVLQLHDHLVLLANSGIVSFPRLPSAFIAFICDDDEFRCSASQLLQHLSTGGELNSNNRSLARVIVAVAPHCAKNIAAWSLECGSTQAGRALFGDSPRPLQDLLASVHAAASSIAALHSDSLFRRRVYNQLVSCANEAVSITTRVRVALTAASDKQDLCACIRGLFLSLLKELKSECNHHDPSPAAISYACIFLASYQVMCESGSQKKEMLSSIFRSFPHAGASSAEVMEAISEVVKMCRSLMQSKMYCELVYESSHPFRCSTHQFDIDFPLAREVSITFDPRTCTNIDWDLKICHGRSSTVCCEGALDDDCSNARNWPGVGETPPLTIPGSSFTVKMLESESDAWGFRFTAAACYDHPFFEIRNLITDVAVNHALQSLLIEERFEFLHSDDAALHERILRDLNFISEIVADHLHTLKRFFEQRPAVFTHVFKWIVYFSLHAADHAAALDCYERYFCFLNMASDLITSCQQVSPGLAADSTLHSAGFMSENCVDVFDDREFLFEMSDIDNSGEAIMNLNVSSSKSKSLNLLSSKSKGWCSNGHLGKVCECENVFVFYVEFVLVRLESIMRNLILNLAFAHRQNSIGYVQHSKKVSQSAISE